MSIIQGLKTGFRKAEDVMTRKQDYRHSVLDPRFFKDVTKGLKIEDPATGKKKVVTEPVKNPAEFAGAYAARLMTDVGTDGTRQFYWRYNHPLAIAEKSISK